jgi:hypothetical protein
VPAETAPGFLLRVRTWPMRRMPSSIDDVGVPITRAGRQSRSSARLHGDGAERAGSRPRRAPTLSFPTRSTIAAAAAVARPRLATTCRSTCC